MGLRETIFIENNCLQIIPHVCIRLTFLARFSLFLSFSLSFSLFFSLFLSLSLSLSLFHSILFTFSLSFSSFHSLTPLSILLFLSFLSSTIPLDYFFQALRQAIIRNQTDLSSVCESLTSQFASQKLLIAPLGCLGCLPPHPDARAFNPSLCCVCLLTPGFLKL